MSRSASNLVSVEWLKSHIDDPHLVILDASMKFKPNGEPIPEARVKIQGAIEFNFDTIICDQKSQLPHMLPSSSEFERAICKLGICKNSKIIIYDAIGIFSSPRAWWMFKVMGHHSVYVLDGGLPRWLEKQGFSQTRYNQPSSAGNFIANFNRSMVASKQQIEVAIDNTHQQVIDARSPARFNGEIAEPRAGLRQGNISGSSNLPFEMLLNNGEYKDKPELKKQFKKIVREQSSQLIFSCGSGVTACVLALAADECGHNNYQVYDGSWSEWGNF